MPNLADVVVCRPQFDTATQYSFAWCQEIVDYLIEHNIPHIDLQKADATRSKVEEALNANPSAMLVHYDHGEETEILGNDLKPVVDLTNVGILANREAYNMNCLSGKVLGPTAHAAGCSAYWGYTEVVSFTTDALKEFQEASNYGFLKRMEGNDWEQCVALTQDKMKALEQQLINVGKYMAAICMQTNCAHLVCYNGGGVPPKLCPFRKLMHKLMPLSYKKVAWKIKRKTGIALVSQILGVGLSVHDFFCECGQIADPLRFPPHGFWWGILLILVGYALWTHDFIEWMKN